MEKLIHYDNVQLSTPPTIKTVHPGVVVELRASYGREVIGKVLDFKITDAGLTCTVISQRDLKRMYPILTGIIGESGHLEPLSVAVTDDRMNIDETLEPFI